MGWFDSEKEDKRQAPEPGRPVTARPTPTPSSKSAGGGSTLGERVHVNGTIVCEESLRILGRIEGKIQAREELTVSKGADVRAVIQGRRVVVEGAVQGDIQASEVVLLGPTASLVGNISTPALHIQEGAFFKGKVEMRAAEAAKSPAKSEESREPERADPAKAGPAGETPAKGARPAESGRQEGAAAAKRGDSRGSTPRQSSS